MSKGLDQKLSERAKSVGFNSLDEMCEIGGTSRQTLRNWLKKNPQRLSVYITGAAAKRIAGLESGKKEKGSETQ